MGFLVSRPDPGSRSPWREESTYIRMNSVIKEAELTHIRIDSGPEDAEPTYIRILSVPEDAEPTYIRIESAPRDPQLGTLRGPNPRIYAYFLSQQTRNLRIYA